MPDTKRVVLRVPVDCEGKSCETETLRCRYAQQPNGLTWYCILFPGPVGGCTPLATFHGGLWRCPECLSAEEREQPESPAPVCDACGPEGCRCEEDRR